MNEMKIIKFNLYMSCLFLAVLVLMLVGTTVAYFSDTRQMASTMTAGNVKIALSEAAVKEDSMGNWVEDAGRPRIFGTVDETCINNYGKIYPGQSVCKDPTITNTGDEAEWIAAKVTLTDGVGNLAAVMGYDGYAGIDIEVLLSGGLLDETIRFGTWNGIPNVCHNDRYAMIQIPNPVEGKYVFYFLMLKPLEAGESVVLFDRLSVPEDWTNSEMQNLMDLKIHVQAFGVQTFQLESCLDAMTAAFPEHFKFN